MNQIQSMLIIMKKLEILHVVGLVKDDINLKMENVY